MIGNHNIKFVGCNRDDFSCVRYPVAAELLSADEYVVFPGFCDVHVHFREPGFSYKETLLSGSEAAAAGGYTAVCTMPNLKPVPDCNEHLKQQLRLIEERGIIKIYPYASITVGQMGKQLSDLQAMADEAALIAASRP